MIEAIFAVAFALRVVRLAVPLVLAGIGGTLTERSGVIDLAIEAKLLFGAFAAACVGHATSSLAAGIAGGMVAGAAVGAVQAYCALWLEADQVIVGIGLDIVALSGTRYLMQLVYGEGANTPPCPALGDAVLGNPIVWLAVLAVVLVPLALRRTRWGLRLRAAGDRPDALVAVGVSPRRTRLSAATLGGALAGAGGAQLSLAVGGFSANITVGRGYFVLAMIILAGWRPAYAALACVGMAIAIALGIELQLARVPIPGELVPLAPYVLTIAALVVFGGRKPPAAIGKL